MAGQAHAIYTLPMGLLDKKVGYTVKRWDNLVRYLIDDGRLRPDRKMAENAIWPFLADRKNRVFSGHPGVLKGSRFLLS